MRYYLGLDAHSASCTLAAISAEGQLLQCRSFDTSAYNLISAVSHFRGYKTLVVEESHMADWVKRTIEPYCDELMICDPKQNQWIWKADHADDSIDAVKLAKLLRAGLIKEVVHANGESQDWRSGFLHYYDLTHEKVRIQLKLKAEYRALAIPTGGDSIYGERQRDKWLKKLEDRTCVQFQVRQYYELFDPLKELQEQTRKSLSKRLRKLKAYEILKSFPGVGETLACGYIAIIDTPQRFSRKNKLWSYAGYGVRRQESDGRVYENRNSKQGNRVLKWIVREHFMGAMRTKKTNRFQRRYQELQKRGLDARQARRTVSRDILSCVRAAWMKGETYQDQTSNSR